MTGNELHELNTEIRGGREMDPTTFYTLLNVAKNTREAMRTWRRLVKVDQSKTSLSSDTYATSKALPSDFRRTLPRRTLKLVSGTKRLDYIEVPIESWPEFRDQTGYFTIDLLNGLYFLSGTVGETYTHYFSYIHKSADIAAGTSWIFIADAHPSLAFDVAAMDELGMDYDDINARQGNANFQRAEIIMKTIVRDDEAMWRSAIGV